VLKSQTLDRRCGVTAGMNSDSNHSENPSARVRRIAERMLRIGLLGASQQMAAATEALRRKITKIEIRLEGIDTHLTVKPVGDIPAPQIDLAGENPVAAIIAAPEFVAATNFFSDNPVASRSLVSPHSQALLYCLVRNLQPDHVFEIGTFRAGTTEAICRALHANGRGRVHTVDPFSAPHVAAVLKHWPSELLRNVELYAMDSMAFYKNVERQGVHPDLVFVDGNHDYEFALFDIGAGARAIAPGGFIFVDNVAQVGPFFAGCDFLAANPGWRELGRSARDYNRDKAFDRNRTTIVNTDFMVLRAPNTYWADDRPRNFNLIRRWQNTAKGVQLKVLPPTNPGMLSVQVVLRGFGLQQAETSVETNVQLGPRMNTSVSLAFDPPAQLTGQFAYFTIEPWLIWHGEEPLRLLEPPQPY
jgi:predicted O-methyltransferase YrrM